MKKSKYKNTIRKWRHKETKDIVKATPWWEIPEPILTDTDLSVYSKDYKVKIGVLFQVGWLVMNKHGVWFGVGPKAAESFTDEGEWKEKKKKDKK